MRDKWEVQVIFSTSVDGCLTRVWKVIGFNPGWENLKFLSKKLETFLTLSLTD